MEGRVSVVNHNQENRYVNQAKHGSARAGFMASWGTQNIMQYILLPKRLLSLFERLDQAGTDDGGVTCYGGDVPKLTVGCKGGVSVCNF